MIKNAFGDGFSSKEDIARNFNISLCELEHSNIIFASYSYEDYSGNALVVYEENGKFFEVHGSHCSCYGLEDQWQPEESSYEHLLERANNNQFSYMNCALLYDNLKMWKENSSSPLNFSFDNLPDALDIEKNLNIHHIIEEKNFFENKEEVFNSIKKMISNGIKNSLLNNKDSLIVNQKLIVNPILSSNMESDKLQKLILNEFKEIQSILLKKNWKTSVSLPKNSNFEITSVQFDITIPSLTSKNTKKNKQKL